MYITKIEVKNFRLLKDSVFDLEEDLSLIIGKNNTGKTSLMVLFDKFYNNKNFSFNDFSLDLRNSLINIDESSDVRDIAIQMKVEIKYDAEDNLRELSEFILDLDPNKTTVKLLFECSIKKEKLLSDISNLEINEANRYITKNLYKYLYSDLYVYNEGINLDSKNEKESLVKKDISQIKNVLNFDIIHARRDVASSEANKNARAILSRLTTQYYNMKNENNNYTEINESIIEMDNSLDKNYEEFFDEFLANVSKFLNAENLKIISDLQSYEIVQNSSKVVYGADESYLPENLNGLGYMNILYLILSIEIKKDKFISDNKDINLLFLEEPEAHTHPQMQYVFSKEIKSILNDIKNLQTVITTHSAHMVSQCDFTKIKYFLKNTIKDKNGKQVNNIEIKNFHNELKEKYGTRKKAFKFIEKYLTINSSELFFADKIIFIEGMSERMLLPYFIDEFDKYNTNEDYKPLRTQNISIMEVGANAKAFNILLEFLNIKTLIITDIDTVEKNEGDRVTYTACSPYANSYSTSNATLKFYYNAPKIDNEKNHNEWFEKLLQGKLNTNYDNINIKYQLSENEYHARSFEDAFINVNLDIIKSNLKKINGLKNKNSIKNFTTGEDIYNLTEDIIDSKSDFSSSILYLALSNNEIRLETPQYIKEGLEWIAK